MRKTQSSKWELRSVIKVIPTNDFTLICYFDNKEIKEFDMKPSLKKGGPMVEPLLKKNFFNKVFLEMGVPTWPNGFDVCADVLYRGGKTITQGKSLAAL